MTYYNQSDSQLINENIFDDLYNKCESLLENMKTDLSGSTNSWILQSCSPADLMKFAEEGEFELPQYYWTTGRINGPKKDDIVISDPIQYESEQEDLSGWVTVTPNGLIPLYVNKKDILKKEKQKQLKLIKSKKYQENNKHNWTMTRKERGLPKKQVKPVKPQPKTQPKPVKQKRRRFKINKSTPIRPNLNTIQEKPKSKYQPKRIAHRYE